MQTIDRVTHGHPLYLALAAEAVLEASGRGTVLTPDDFERADVSPEVDSEHEGKQLRDYLLTLFLRQLSKTERNELIFCAVPRFLDVALVRTILQLPNDLEARERWERYRRLSFMNAIDTQRIVLHPLVRTLLLRQLPPDHEPTSDYSQIHDRLRAYFHTRASIQQSPVQSGREEWQTSLEEAYHDLPTGERVANLQQAIAYYQSALLVRTQDAFPVDWATTQNNLGNAYSDLPTGEQATNLQQAIFCYQLALLVLHSTGMDYYSQIVSSNLEKAKEELRNLENN